VVTLANFTAYGYRNLDYNFHISWEKGAFRGLSQLQNL